MAGRIFDVVLHLLDHQLVDDHGRLAGKVDDAEIRIEADGGARIDALLSGPGILAERLGHRRYGRWRQRVERALEPGDTWRTRIPMGDVREISTRIRLTLDHRELASDGSERWFDDHVISHIPGASHDG
jgi:hypothetical protein